MPKDVYEEFVTKARQNKPKKELQPVNLRRQSTWQLPSEANRVSTFAGGLGEGAFRVELAQRFAELQVFILGEVERRGRSPGPPSAPLLRAASVRPSVCSVDSFTELSREPDSPKDGGKEPLAAEDTTQGFGLARSEVEEDATQGSGPARSEVEEDVARIEVEGPAQNQSQGLSQSQGAGLDSTPKASAAPSLSATDRSSSKSLLPSALGRANSRLRLEASEGRQSSGFGTSSRPGAAYGSTTISAHRRQHQVENVHATLASKTHHKKSSASWRALFSYVDHLFNLIVVLNCGVIGLSTSVAEDWLGWLVIDGVFSFLFVLEQLLKVAALRSVYVFGSDRWWHLFEVFLVVLGLVELGMGIETYGTSSDAGGFGLLRMLRLARIPRLIRLIRIPVFMELTMMVQGAFGGVRTLCWASVLMCLPLYAAAIFFRESLGVLHEERHGAELFASVPLAFFTLFRCVVSEECTDQLGRPIFSHVASYHGWGYSFAYCGLEVFMSFGLFNVIIAIFIENVLAASRHNDMIVRRERLRDEGFFAFKMGQLASVLYKAAKEHNGEELVTLPPIEQVLDECAEMDFTLEIIDEAFELPRAQAILQDLSIADEELRHLRRVLDVDNSGTVDLGELFDGIAHIRGAPCRSDIVILNFQIERMYEEMTDQRLLLETMYQLLGVVPRPAGPPLEGLDFQTDAAEELPCVAVAGLGSPARQPLDASRL